MVSQFNQGTTRAMTEEQFCQVVDAILNGKYSWACVLILSFAGYNPLHYIPYRTYNRLMKENRDWKKSKGKNKEKDVSLSVEVENLPYMKMANLTSKGLKGGNGFSHLEDSFCLPELMTAWR
jgi:hypothetical protein